MDASNTYRVFDWLWTSGQLSERDIDELPKLGVEAVINLALPTSSNALPGEAERITSRGISYFQIPVLWEAPQLSQLQAFFGILDALKGRKIWVHCAMNMRVSAFIYLYRRLRMNETEEQASYPMTNIWEPNQTWKDFMQQATG
jgi:protein tyrosine phosphatase (PTP) superfamily phosphohydrolase (DUF442 family)